MNAPVRQFPSPNWTWDGTRWVCTASIGTVVITKVFTASGPYTPSPGLQSLTVETVGGGGGGGGSFEAAAGQINAGAGGGSGGRSQKTLAAPVVAGGVNVVIGAGGAGGNAAVNGSAGGATSFGALCVANGGLGGGTQSASVFAPGPGAGAPPGVGDLAFPGNSGQPGFWEVWSTGTNITAAQPMGGSIVGGVQALIVAPLQAVNGLPGYANTGAGGGGAVQNQDPGGQAGGGQGGSGICWVTEYCWADAGDTGCGCPPSGGARVAITGGPQGWAYHEDGE